MSFKILILLFVFTSCGVKAPPKPKNDNFPSFIEKNKKVLRPVKKVDEKAKKKEE